MKEKCSTGGGEKDDEAKLRLENMACNDGEDQGAEARGPWLRPWLVAVRRCLPRQEASGD